MRRPGLQLVLLALCAPGLRAQTGFTTVSAQVLDPNNVPYAGCSGNASFVPAPTATTFPTLSGSVFNTVVVISQCDSSGNFTLKLADNNLVTDGHPTGQQASKWKFAIQSQDGKTGFSCTLTITGATQTITTQLKACAAVLILPGSVAPGTPTNLAFYQTPNQLASSVYTYTAADTSGSVCNLGVACASVSVLQDSGIGLLSTDSGGSGIMFAGSDSTGAFSHTTSFTSSQNYIVSAESVGFIANEFIGGSTTGGNCFNGGAGSAPCAVGYVAAAGDTTSTFSGVSGQDAVEFLAVPSFRRTGPTHLGNVAGLAVLTPLNCTSGFFPCGAAAESAVNLWGIEIQDLQGRGTTSAIGLHIEPQTNPAAGNFAIKVEASGGPSSFQNVIPTQVTSASSNPAQSGFLRLNANDSITWRNQPNTADTTFGRVTPGGNAPTDVLEYQNATGPAPIWGNPLIATSCVSSGFPVLGALRLCTGDTIAWRNNANSGDVQLQKNNNDSLLYNNLALPQVVATANLAAQTANAGPTTVYAVPSTGAGTYWVTECYLIVTTAAGVSSTLPSCSIVYTDNDTSVVTTLTMTNANSTNGVGAFGSMNTQPPPSGTFNAKASTNIQYQFSGYASNPAATMQYAAHVKIAYLGP